MFGSALQGADLEMDWPNFKSEFVKIITIATSIFLSSCFSPLDESHNKIILCKKRVTLDFNTGMLYYLSFKSINAGTTMPSKHFLSKPMISPCKLNSNKQQGTIEYCYYFFLSQAKILLNTLPWNRNILE